MDFDLVFFGVNLLPFIVGIVALLRAETGIPANILDWISGLLIAGAAVLALGPIQEYLMALVGVELIFKAVITFIGVLLTVKGYWPTVRMRVASPTDPVAAAKAGGGRLIIKNVFTRKY